MRLVKIHQYFPDGGDPGGFDFELALPVDQAVKRLHAIGFPVLKGERALEDSDGYTHYISLLPSPDNDGHSLFGCGWG